MLVGDATANPPADTEAYRVQMWAPPTSLPNSTPQKRFYFFPSLHPFSFLLLFVFNRFQECYSNKHFIRSRTESVAFISQLKWCIKLIASAAKYHRVFIDQLSSLDCQVQFLSTTWQADYLVKTLPSPHTHSILRSAYLRWSMLPHE
jgi:hypothetical protein